MSNDKLYDADLMINDIMSDQIGIIKIEIADTFEVVDTFKII